jgi:hypothetical protein
MPNKYEGHGNTPTYFIHLLIYMKLADYQPTGATAHNQNKINHKTP